MANENASKFEEMQRGDKELQTKLRELVAAYEGNKADGQAVFDATIGKLAAEAGIPFTFADGREAMLGEHELSDDELEAVAGGGTYCYLIGGGSDVVADCDEHEGYACAYLGLTGSRGF
ncbi:MAG: hypothetical protein IJG82_06400 [Atopobiaceae bacterium]|nr:hypothetical protein [Atopobiaceae bacterium]